MKKFNFKRLTTFSGVLLIGIFSLHFFYEGINAQAINETTENARNKFSSVLAVTDKEETQTAATTFPKFEYEKKPDEMVGVISIPSVGIENAIFYGASNEELLEKGVAITERSTENVTIILGHNYEHSTNPEKAKSMFSELPNAKIGDTVMVNNTHYTITNAFRVLEKEYEADDWAYVDNYLLNLSTDLILITCKNEDERGRWIVLCDFSE